MIVLLVVRVGKRLQKFLVTPDEGFTDLVKGPKGQPLRTRFDRID